MPARLNQIIIIASIITITVLVYLLYSMDADVNCSDSKAQRYQLDQGFQTSARYLSKLAKLDACQHPDNQDLQDIMGMIHDVNIKASSYALINKIFFYLSLIFAVGIIVFPIVHSIADKDSMTYRIFNPAQLPAITLLAGLCFTFYSDYKGRQTSAENLIRYAYFSSDSVVLKSDTIRKGLAEIDSGQSFGSLIPTEQK